MFLRDESATTTLAEVSDTLAGLVGGESLLTATSDIQVNLDDAEPTVRLVGRDIEVPASTDAVLMLGGWLDIPAPFLRRVDLDIKQHLLSTLLSRSPGEVVVVVGENGIVELRDPNAKFFDHRAMVDCVAKVIDSEAPVLAWWRNSADFRLDVVVPDGFDRGIGGDPKQTLKDEHRSVKGDVTKAGIRVGHDVKHNLAPWVQPFLYRLWCTNGAEVREDGLKIDARGSTLEAIMVEFEAVADRAFKIAERGIAPFYDLRNQPVTNPERVLMRIGSEHHIPPRSLGNLISAAPSLPDDATMFDLVNLVTNEANNPSLHREGGRRLLQRVGGEIVGDHAARCSHCQAKLV